MFFFAHVLPDRAGRQLAGRQCRHGLRAEGTVPHSGRLRAQGAVRRVDDRPRARVARSDPAPARRRWLPRCAILVGSALSAALAPPALVIASAAAFLLSEFADLAVYTPLARRRLIAAVVASGAVGLVVDSRRVPLPGVRLARIPRRAGGRQGRRWCSPRSPSSSCSAGAMSASASHGILALRTSIMILPTIRQALEGIATATITTVLLKKGIRRSWLAGPEADLAGISAAGRARLHAALRAGARGSGDAGSPGPRRSRRAPPSRRCRRAASASPTRWASPRPASSATFWSRA